MYSLLTFFFRLTFLYEPHGARSDRNDVSMSTLLLSISNKFVVGDAMPKVDYRTCVDIYVDTCFYLQVLTMLANAIVEKYQDVEFLGATGRHLNLIFFILELVAAFCLHEWLIINLWNHRADIEEWVEASKKPFPTVEPEDKETEHVAIRSFDALTTSPFQSKNLTPFAYESGKDNYIESLKDEETDYIENLINSLPDLRLGNFLSKTSSKDDMYKSPRLDLDGSEHITAPILDATNHTFKDKKKNQQKTLVIMSEKLPIVQNHRKVSCIAKALIFMEKISQSGPYNFFSHKGAVGSTEEAAGEKKSVMAHRKGSFIDFGASMSGVSEISSKSTVFIDEARELKTMRNTELLSQMAEEFKSSLTRTNFKEALAIRRNRKERGGSFIANAWSASNHSDKDNDLGAYLSTDTRDISREEEDLIMRNLAARFLQSRWRILSARSHLVSLRNLRAHALLEGFACRIQRTFRLRKMMRALHSKHSNIGLHDVSCL